MTIFNLITLFGGLALFLYGMRLMGDGLKKGSSDAFKRAMEKVTNNPLVGFLLGLVVTAVIQSSTATIVLTSGLVGAGVMSLHQSIGVILGANVGTTITGQIIRLLDVNASETSLLNFFKPSTLAPLAAIIGILFLMAVKTRQSDTIGSTAMGFGILFTGLLSMTAAVSPLSESETFANMFYQLSGKPVFGFLLGAGVAFLLQSSSATIGILQAIATTGALTFSSVYAIIIGVNIGDCVTTAIVCSIGSKADAKRTGVIHILFNIAGSILVIVGLMLLHSFGVLDALWDEALSSGGIANVHTVFRLVSAIVLLPVCGMTAVSQQSGKGGSGCTRSPRPCTRAVPPTRQNGTSLPSCAPSAHSCGRDNPVRYSRSRAKSTPAASALPPAIPAWLGVAFTISSAAPPRMPVACKNSCAARHARLRLSAGTSAASAPPCARHVS